MSVIPQWDNPEQDILVYKFEGQWTWDELTTAVDQARDMLHTTDHRVDIIVDMEHSSGIPRNAVRQLRRFSSGENPRIVLRVLVGGGAVASSLLNIYISVYRKARKKFRTAKTRQQAYAIISKERMVSPV